MFNIYNAPTCKGLRKVRARETSWLPVSQKKRS